MDVPVKSLGYSDFIKEGQWSEVDEALRGVYQEASEALGREFEYPENWLTLTIVLSVIVFLFAISATQLLSDSRGKVYQK